MKTVLFAGQVSDIDHFTKVERKPLFFAKILQFFYLLEREENVKADIFQAYVSLLRQTKPVAATDTLQDSKDR